jgi:Mrp family chromosome partitioning ATPase
MSRNFELLQKFGKEQEIFHSQETVTGIDEPESVATAPLTSPTAPLNIGEKELEEVTKLVQRLFLLSGTESPRAVVFVGTEPGNGCSWMCARAAEVLAGQIAGSVCLVDANLRQPSLHEMFDIPNHYGLTDALRFNEPIANFTRPLSRANLHLLSCGSTEKDSQAQVTSDRMRLRLAELGREFDYLLIDSPALSICNDAVVLGCASDGVVMVLKANSSRRESAKKALDELQAARARVLGAVLNQRTFPIPESIYRKF